MIDTIVFDMGQVLIRWNPEALLEHFSLTREQKELLLKQVFRSVEWVALDRGVISEEEAACAMCARLPSQLHGTVREIVAHWHGWYLDPMPGMEPLLRELKQAGFRLYLLSNAGTALRSYFPGIPGWDCFDGLMVSAEEKLLKPQHEIYERLYARFGLEPERCLFVDDAPANAEGAIRTGMQAVIFRGDVCELRRELLGLGVKLTNCTK